MVQLVVTVLLVLGLGAAGEAESARANPIRKVVTMLQDMVSSVESEGKQEKELFDKFMCYCSNGAGSLESSIASAAEQIESLTGKVATESAQKSQLEQDVAQHKTDRTDAEKTIKEQTAMREKESAEYASTSGEMKANIEAMTSALAALRKGLSAAMLQTGVGDTLRNIVAHSPAVSALERSTLASFLEEGTASEMTGSTDTIIGIVDQMKETLEGDLKESTAQEEESKADFATLVASKEKEVAAAGAAIESKTARLGELSVSIVQGKADLEDTQEALAEDEQFKANLAAQCATKSKEWDARCKNRAMEVQALSETIEMLNGDEALELFKKTLPSPGSFLQVATTTRAEQKRAAMLLRRLVMQDPAHAGSLQMILLSLKSGMHGGFDKVVKMVDDMVAQHGEEQKQDDKKKDFCISEMDLTEDDAKTLAKSIADLDATITEMEDEIATLSSEIAALQQGLKDLDKSVAEATEQRKDEHAEYTSTAAANQAAVELIGMAKNRMQKFYNPSQYKAPPTTTESSSPYGLLQVSSRAAPGPAPETFEGEYKKSEGSTSVLALMDEMVKDVEMDIQEAKHDEEVSQKDYESSMKDAATKRSEDSKLAVEKEGVKADVQMNLEAARADHKTKSDQLRNTQGKMNDLHMDCDHLLQSYDERKANRAKYVDGLKESKAVLAGAKFGF